MAIVYGINSPFFAMSLCFSLLFWYDAANVRYQAGQHAQYLNYFYRLLHELEKVGIHEKHLHHLKERLGHTVIEVIGGIVTGMVLTFMLYGLLHV
jgi:acid phosphatase family membrane protein YuiD